MVRKRPSGAAAREWLAARAADLLPVGYFHVVFTLPTMRNPLSRTRIFKSP